MKLQNVFALIAVTIIVAGCTYQRTDRRDDPEHQPETVLEKFGISIGTHFQIPVMNPTPWTMDVTAYGPDGDVEAFAEMPPFSESSMTISRLLPSAQREEIGLTAWASQDGVRNGCYAEEVVRLSSRDRNKVEIIDLSRHLNYRCRNAY